MPVGFQNLPPFQAASMPFTHDVPSEPWALRFSRFEDEAGETGALTFSSQQGVGALGAGVTVAHTDTGYTEHPELMHGGAVRVNDARTFTFPVPSYLTYGPGWRQFYRSTSAQVNQVYGHVSYSSTNGLQVAAGASVSVGWTNDGKDSLAGVFPMNPSHGTSTASVILSRPGAPSNVDFPSYLQRATDAEKIPLTAINGAAPAARLLPIRVSDTVIVDPIVANNLAMGILYAAERALTDIEIGVISISMGWPGGSAYQNYTQLAKALDLATRSGLVVCAAAAQSGFGIAPALESYADLAEGVGDGASSAAGVALDAAKVAALTVAIAQFTKLSLGNHQNLDDLADDIIAKARAAGRSAKQIESYLQKLSALAHKEARAARAAAGFIESLVGYPGTDPNTICCAACDFRGDPMLDGLYGPDVDISAPGVHMFNAKSVLDEDGDELYFTQQGIGTSYATAITAAACALWQAHHGRQNLIDIYGRPLMLHLFRWALKHSAATQTVTGAQAPWDDTKRGFGMLDAKALLTLQLPNNAETLIDNLAAENLITGVERALLRTRVGL